MIVFHLIGTIEDCEAIATGSRIRDVAKLRKLYGKGKWRKMKGVGLVRLSDGTVCSAELHWYEAHGIGKREMKVKQLFE